LIEELFKRPYAFDFFHAVRLFECRRQDLPKVGFSISPSEDPVRFWQKPSLRFAPAAIDSVRGTILVEIERGVAELLKKTTRPADSELQLRVLLHPELFDVLSQQDSQGIPKIEQRHRVKLSFEADARLRPRKFSIPYPGGIQEFKGEVGHLPRIAVNFFGLFGPNAPLPPHLTEYLLEREMRHEDPTATAFLNIFHHRLLSMFYRAWAANQKALDLDRPKNHRFDIYIGALFGVGMESLQEQDAVPDPAKLFFSGRMACQTRNAEGLESILRSYFNVPVEVQPFAGRWLDLPDDSHCRLGESVDSGSLGFNTILGARFWDCQLSFRMRFGPMSLADYERLLPNGKSFERVRCWILNYCGQHFFWDLQLVLRADEVPQVNLGQFGRLGWTSWLKTKPFTADADQLILNPPPD
jgi:type VI secretion system protein ImpH